MRSWLGYKSKTVKQNTFYYLFYCFHNKNGVGDKFSLPPQVRDRGKTPHNRTQEKSWIIIYIVYVLFGILPVNDGFSLEDFSFGREIVVLHGKQVDRGVSYLTKMQDEYVGVSNLDF